MKEKSIEEQKAQQEWIEQVYYGNCCSHPDDDCDMGLKGSKNKKERSEDTASDSNQS